MRGTRGKRSASTGWLDPEDLRHQEAFRRLLGIPGSLRVPLVHSIKGRRIWLSRDMRGGSCLLPSLFGAAALLVALFTVVREGESTVAAGGIALAIALLTAVGALEKMANPSAAVIDLEKGVISVLGRWRWSPGTIRSFPTKDLYLDVHSAALDGWTGGETPRGVLVHAVFPHPDERESAAGPPALHQFLLASSELPEDQAMKEIEAGVAALKKAFTWKGVVVRAFFTIDDPDG